ncbi:MAG TPA: sigma-70 family RNA polymerase sigma factor [Thermoanaerobaculia bacterium]|nr:sigma-70 family RNA polymerase sigma factor [Thermoanaerobaculia bacterium]
MWTRRTARIGERPSRDEERELVDRMLAGDEGAFDELVDGYVPGLFRFALERLEGNEDLAQELVQSTLCKCVARLGGFRREASLFTWLCACCLNEIRMHFRSMGRKPVHLELDETTATVAAPAQRRERGPESAMISRERTRLVHRALDELPPRYARALEWMYLERVPVAEVGRRLGIGAKAAESLLTRARAAFRGAYGELSRAPGRRRLRAV